MSGRLTAAAPRDTGSGGGSMGAQAWLPRVRDGWRLRRNRGSTARRDDGAAVVSEGTPVPRSAAPSARPVRSDSFHRKRPCAPACRMYPPGKSCKALRDFDRRIYGLRSPAEGAFLRLKRRRRDCLAFRCGCPYPPQRSPGGASHMAIAGGLNRLFRLLEARFCSDAEAEIKK